MAKEIKTIKVTVEAAEMLKEIAELKEDTQIRVFSELVEKEYKKLKGKK